jgi:hypothetical protein
MSNSEDKLRELLFGNNDSDDDADLPMIDPLVVRREEQPEYFYAGKRKRDSEEEDDEEEDDEEEEETIEAGARDVPSAASTQGSVLRARPLQGVGGPAPPARKRARAASEEGEEGEEEAENDEIEFADISEVRQQMFRKFQGEIQVPPDPHGDDRAHGSWCFLCHFKPDRQLDKTTRENFERMVSYLVNSFPLMDERRLAINVQAQYNAYFRQYTGRPWTIEAILEHVKRHEVVPKVSRTEEYHVLDTMAHILCTNGMVVKEPNGKYSLNFPAVNMYLRLTASREKIRKQMDRDAADDAKR